MSIVEKSLSKFRESRSEVSGALGRVVDPAAFGLPHAAGSNGSSASGSGAAAVATVPQGHAPFVERRRVPRRDPLQPRFFESLGPKVVSLDPARLRGLGLYASVESEAAIEDQFRRIKWPLLEGAIGRDTARTPRGRLMLVTSSLAAEGKTFCSMNLALSLARERDLSVVLVDGDVRKADVSHALGLERERGLVDLVTNPQLSPKDVCLRTSVPQLYLLPAGQLTVDIPELWASARMEALMEELSLLDRQSIVVLDSSPILLTNETQVLTRLVGQVVFVVRADATPRSTISDALALVDPAPQVACVLNQSAEAVGEYYRYGRYPYGGNGRSAAPDAAGTSTPGPSPQ